MKSTNKKGFTLVELIIVITILAILATIAFVSFQSYTKDARNSKRMSDLNTIAQAIEVKLANSINVIDLVDTSGTSRKKANTENLAGKLVSVIPATQYNATNKINFNIVGAKAEDFTDPKDKSNYLIGATSLAGGAYEVAAELYETDAGTGARIDGNYKYRSLSNSGVVASTGAISSSQYTLSLSGSAGLGMFKVGDITNFGEIIGVSNDLTRLTISGATYPAVNAAVYLSGMTASVTEMKSLIGGLTGY